MLSRFFRDCRGSITSLAAGVMIVAAGVAAMPAAANQVADSLMPTRNATVSGAGTRIGGYYVMRVPGVADPLPWKVFTRPGVDGVNLRYYWRDLEPSQGKFHWRDLDHDLARTLAAGKKFSIGVHSGGFSPSWLYAGGTGIRPIAYSATPRAGGCNDFVAPVPYDPPYAVAYTAMLAKVKAHLESLGALDSLTMVKVTPFNSASEELHLPSSPYERGSCQSDAQSAWLMLGYRPSLVLAAFKTVYDGMTAIFPGVVFSFNTIQGDSFPGISEDGQKVRRNDDMAEAIIGYALAKTPGRVAVEATALSSVPSSPKLVLWAKSHGAIQGWETNDHGGRHSAGCPDRGCHVIGYTRLLQNGIASGAPYIEVWPHDAINFSSTLFANPFEIEQ